MILKYFSLHSYASCITKSTKNMKLFSLNLNYILVILLIWDSYQLDYDILTFLFYITFFNINKVLFCYIRAPSCILNWRSELTLPLHLFALKKSTKSKVTCSEIPNSYNIGWKQWSWPLFMNPNNRFIGS